jgi:hypothetical protein
MADVLFDDSLPRLVATLIGLVDRDFVEPHCATHRAGLVSSRTERREMMTSARR